MDVVTTTLVPSSVCIDQEEIDVLIDIRNRCYFPTAKERQKFEEVVCRSVGVQKFSEIPSDVYETAFNVAKVTLQNRGEQILRGGN